MKLLELFIEVSVKGNKALNGLAKVERRATETEKSLAGVGSGAAALATKFAAVAGGAYGLVRGLGFVVNSGAQIQEGMTGIAKTTGLAGKELDHLRGAMSKLAADSSVNSTTAQLFELAQTAGTMGLTATKDILLFTETLAKLDGASGGKLGGERAGQLLTAILSASGEGIEDLDNLASAFVALGNEFRVNESQIAGVADRVFKSLARFDVSSSEVAGLSAAFAELQITPELAGSSIARVLGQLEKSLGTNGKSMRAFEKVTGKSRKELAAMFKRDTVKSFLAVAEGLKEVQLQGENVPTLLEDMGLSSIQIAQVMPLLGHDIDRVRQIINRANGAFADNTALTDEAAAAGATWNAKMQAMQNSMLFLGDAIARSGVLDALTSIVESMTKMVGKATAWINSSNGYAETFKKIATSVKDWSGSFGTVIGAMFATRLAFGLFGKTMLGGMTAFVGAMIAKVALLVAELVGLKKLMGATTGKASVGNSKTPKTPSAPKGPGRVPILGPVAIPAIAAEVAKPHAKAIDDFFGKGGGRIVTEIMALLGDVRAQELQARYADPLLQVAKQLQGRLNAEDLLMGATGPGGGASPHSFVAPHMTAEQMQAAGARTEITNNTNTVGDFHIAVHAETNADPQEIANIARAEVERGIAGAMLDATN